MDVPSLTARPQPLRRVARLAAALALLGATAVGLVAQADPAAAVTRQYGTGPLDAVKSAAAAKASCGLDANQLAAMMMAPTYAETGGTVPSPMTLSRWDDNAKLYAFGSRSTAYLKAFWSPGVGLWQFDSAGGWNLTAATAIDAVTSANQAAATIAYRWCNAPSSKQTSPTVRRQYAWGPWYGCSSTTTCETIYNDLTTGGGLTATSVAGVTRYGGMESRQCDVPGVGTGVTCWYVDPARVQGSNGWTQWPYQPGNGSTPLTAPFYVVEAGGREYRYWIQADTGYDADVVAHKPVTANARTSLTWAKGTATLCDRTAQRGGCEGPAVQLLLRNSNTSGFADVNRRFEVEPGGQVLMCDWNGDGIDTPVSIRGTIWSLTDSPQGGPATRVFAYGEPSDVPVCGDWNGDGSDEPGIVRNGWWYLAPSVGAPYATVIFPYGNPGDVPLVGDWNGDGLDEPAVFRQGWWYFAPAPGIPLATVVYPYGDPGDRPVVGDWNGDGRDKPAVFRGSLWFQSYSPGYGYADNVFSYGVPSDIPVAGSWNGQPGSSVGVVR